MSNPPPDDNLLRRRMRSLVASRFDIQLPVLLIFVAFVVAAAIFLFREISADRLRLFRGAQPITFLASNTEGLGFGSELVCQGLVVGRVRAVRVADESRAVGEEGLHFAVEAALEKPYARWRFQKGPTVRAGIGPSYLGLSSIELRVAEILPPGPKPPAQVLELHVEQGRMGRLKDDVAQLMEAVVRDSDDLGRRIREGTASSIERTLWNLDRLTEKMDHAVTVLTVDSAGERSPLTQLVSSTDKLAGLVDDLGGDVRSLAKESAETVRLSQDTVARLDATIARIERSSLEVLGESPAQRKAMRAELLETLKNLREASDSLKNLVPRVGDTGLGRMLIKKDKKADSPGH